MRAFSEKGISLSPERFIQISPKADNVYNTIREIVEGNVQFDSIVAFSDLIAFEIMSMVKNVPVIGFDAINSHLHMPLRNVSVGMVNGGLAEKATNALLRKIEGEKDKVHELIDVVLFEFNS